MYKVFSKRWLGVATKPRIFKGGSEKDLRKEARSCSRRGRESANDKSHTDINLKVLIPYAKIEPGFSF